MTDEERIASDLRARGLEPTPFLVKYTLESTSAAWLYGTLYAVLRRCVEAGQVPTPERFDELVLKWLEDAPTHRAANLLQQMDEEYSKGSVNTPEGGIPGRKSH